MLCACVSSMKWLTAWSDLALLLMSIYNNHSIPYLTRYPSLFCFQTSLMWLLCDLLCVHHFKVASFLFYSVPKGSVSHEKHLKFVHLFFVLVVEMWTQRNGQPSVSPTMWLLGTFLPKLCCWLFWDPWGGCLENWGRKCLCFLGAPVTHFYEVWLWGRCICPLSFQGAVMCHVLITCTAWGRNIPIPAPFTHSGIFFFCILPCGFFL